jgi:4-hydroxybenzoate polyprenyltransferase
LPADARSRQAEKRPSPRPALPLRRLFLLTFLTAALAFALQALLAATNAPAADALILLLVPIAAGAVIFLGLRPYPAAGRLRLAIMVAVALFLVGLTLG